MLINIKSRSIYFERLFYLVIARRNDEAISISTLLYLRKYSNTQILKYSNTQILKYSNTQLLKTQITQIILPVLSLKQLHFFLA